MTGLLRKVRFLEQHELGAGSTVARVVPTPFYDPVNRRVRG